jgi:phosphohistidine phosphatase
MRHCKIPAVLILVHHGDAVSEDVDTQRPLSPRGLAGAERLAEGLRARGVVPDCLWHSGKLRARQTAEAIWRVCNPRATFSAVRGLQPADHADTLRTQMADEARVICVVGHFPHLPRALSLLTTGLDDSLTVFPAHGAVALERVDVLRWREAWRIAEEGQ